MVSGWLRDKRDDLVWWWRFDNGKTLVIALSGLAAFAAVALVGVGFGRVMRGLPI